MCWTSILWFLRCESPKNYQKCLSPFRQTFTFHSTRSPRKRLGRQRSTYTRPRYEPYKLWVLLTTQLSWQPQHDTEMTYECEIEIGKTVPIEMVRFVNKTMHFREQCLRSSNFFVFQSYELRFSGFFYMILKRSFPGYMLHSASGSGYP